MTSAPIESIFSRAWQLLQRNWIIIVPGVVIGLIAGTCAAIAGLAGASAVSSDGTFHPAGAMAAMTTGFLAGIIGLVGYVATQAYTVGMAGAAWTRGTTTLADGAAALQDSAMRIVVTAIGLLVLGFIAFFLSFLTFGLAFIAFVLFTLYAMPAAIIGKRDGFAAISESFQVAKMRFVPTLIIAVMIGVISLVVGIITLPLHFIPLLGPIVAAIITQIVVAFAVLVIVGEYLSVHGATPVAAYAAPATDAYATGSTTTYVPPPPPVDPGTNL